MFYWIYDVPTTTLALMFAVAFIGFSWLGALFILPVVRSFVRNRIGDTNNDVAAR